MHLLRPYYIGRNGSLLSGVSYLDKYETKRRRREQQELLQTFTDCCWGYYTLHIASPLSLLSSRMIPRLVAEVFPLLAIKSQFSGRFSPSKIIRRKTSVKRAQHVDNAPQQMKQYGILF